MTEYKSNILTRLFAQRFGHTPHINTGVGRLEAIRKTEHFTPAPIDGGGNDDPKPVAKVKSVRHEKPITVHTAHLDGNKDIIVEKDILVPTRLLEKGWGAAHPESEQSKSLGDY